MSRALLILANDAIRRKARDWIARAPKDTRVEFKAPRRTLDQNARMWAMLTDIASQATHLGRKYDTARWKLIFMHALGQETEFIPSLDGLTFISCNGHSSDLTKEEMSALIELMFAWGAEHDLVWSDPTQAVAA